MARRRCLDDKAAVRKAGVQLMEALLLMRAQGLGGAAPELPCEQDIRALEAATADSLVCGPFRLFPMPENALSCSGSNQSTGTSAFFSCAKPEEKSSMLYLTIANNAPCIRQHAQCSVAQLLTITTTLPPQAILQLFRSPFCCMMKE